MQRTYKHLSFLILAAGLLLGLGCGAHDPEAEAQEAILAVLESAYEKNPEGIQAQLEEDPAEAHDVMRRITLAQPPIEAALRDKGLWERRDEMFERAFSAFLIAKLAEEPDEG